MNWTLVLQIWTLAITLFLVLAVSKETNLTNIGVIGMMYIFLLFVFFGIARKQDHPTIVIGSIISVPLIFLQLQNSYPGYLSSLSPIHF